MMAHPALVVAVVVLLSLAWAALIVWIPLEDEEVESLDPWPPEPRPIPSNVRLLIGANIFDFNAEEATPWADDGI